MAFKQKFVYCGCVNDSLKTFASRSLKEIYEYYKDIYSGEKSFPAYSSFSGNISKNGYYTYLLKEYQNAKLLVFAAPDNF